MTDFAERRNVMVDTQVRPSDVTRFGIISAMLEMPRELFVPISRREAAYVGENLHLGGGRVLLEPRTFAKMLEALALGPADLVLDLGCGYGYSSAVAARLAQAVVGVESNEEMAGEAPEILAETGADNVVIQQANLAEGAPEHGPYDAIMIQGAVEQVPGPIAEQLKEGGRIVCLFMEGALGTVRLGIKSGGILAWRHEFNATAPVIEGFEKPREFAL
ncbi:protein-L-isoaspartate O-methyltransferase family protein [Pontibaca methylaminivorans]|uniref:Protein-L-isoaspartate O-methyltransferase n=1 Tax=Pontibaca methylaminivorans TaxID=515897 RepID=A0A1R3WV78_9RHOB|nr:protein-L-isoaspartate O-methyltransferase [Pontibaca methylaminivorans]SIT81932.1 protein-L-isoaspartate(D-aspartate) O-methyltransferase [Pontibaca methylaminivorans]